MLRLIEHVLQPIGAVRHLYGHPIGLVILHSSVPIWLETQSIEIKVILRLAVIDEEPDMDHAMRNGRGRSRRNLLFPALDKLDAMPIRVRHAESQAMIRAPFNLCWLDSFRR